jgi:ankyrin repeat protein
LSDCDKKGLKIKNENINSFSLLTNKNFYKNSPQYKSNKILLKNKLLNTSEEKDNHFDNKKESNENEVEPFLFQLNENYYNIKNKGQFLLEHRKTVEDIYIGLSFLIVENNEKMFINKIKELKDNIDINHQFFEGNTFLIMAAREGNKNITYFLCQQRCEINIQNDKGNTALHYAIGNLFFDVVDILISFGANEEILNYNGLRPWDCIEYNLE